MISNNGLTHNFHFNRVFPGNTDQDEMFTNTSEFLADKVLNGFNAAILAYGQTGSGKTYTLLGPGYDNAANIGRVRDAELRGVAPRMIQSIFNKVYSTYD